MHIKNTMMGLLVLCVCSQAFAQGNQSAKRRGLFQGSAPAEASGEKSPLSLKSKQRGKADFSSRLSHGDLADVKLKDGKTYTRLLIPGVEAVGEPGMPELPRREELIRIPAGAKVKLVIDSVSWQDIDGEVELPPVQPPLPDARGPNGEKPDTQIPFVKNASVYASDTFLNPEPVSLGGVVRIRGREYVQIIYTPVSYNPAKKTVKVASAVEWHLDLQEPKEIKRRRHDRLMPDEGDALDARTSEDIEAEMPLDNVVPVDSSNLENQDASPSPDLVSVKYDADYLIITPDAFADEIAPFAEWKHKKGFKTYVATLTEVGGTTEAAIKAYIQDVYNNNSVILSFV
ncbi:MAG TPA: hypothetical protein DCS43_08385, partial [Verrucomicrobia bacterium]|nr:hypothetical protein [Verrucomicrobiota bacterium]